VAGFWGKLYPWENLMKTEVGEVDRMLRIPVGLGMIAYEVIAHKSNE